jgi:hypothetical protein
MEGAMADRPANLYPHRKTTDGSYISICMSCLATVARTKTEARLEELEKSHVCYSYLVTERGHSCGPVFELSRGAKVS